MLQRSVALAFLSALFLPYSAMSQSSAPTDEVGAPDLYTPPIATHAVPVDCSGESLRTMPRACAELNSGVEGWVLLNFMVNAQGKPFEVMVAHSSGNKEFELAATRAIDDWQFKPGMLNGQVIEGDTTVKFLFVQWTAANGANPEFITQYKALQQAINASDRAAADAALKNLVVKNLYENAYSGMAIYLYAKRWGDEDQQLEGLRRAVAEENKARYLPKEVLAAALRESFVLQIRRKHYGEALNVFRNLEKSALNDTAVAQFRPIVEQVQKLQQDGTRYDVEGAMPDGSWNLQLFKRHFSVSVKQGLIESIKMRCAKRFILFNFDPKLEYQVSPKEGGCNLQLVGAPGTQFALTQY